MHLVSFCSPRLYGTPFSSTDRARTIAALLIAQGNQANLSQSEMRRDVLTGLTSSRAVGYWLNDMGWLERTRTRCSYFA